ncbi:hypothetical protein [Streptomyces sp. NPDC047453]|uniref:hypothetical protein n=1 Tax=Streptomyces sp. NPDC047453 TaxID=3154812 RepID=UPI003403B17A
MFLYGLTALWDRQPKQTVVKYGRRGRPRRPDPAPALPPSSCSLQPALFAIQPDFTRWRASTALYCDNPWLAWGRHTAHRLGETRGWPRQTRLNVDQALVMLLSGHADGDVIRYSEIAPMLRARGLSTVRTTDVLDHMGVFLDDRPATFDLWLERKLDGLAVGIRGDVEGWARTLHDGGPRSRARHRATVWNYLNRIRPALREWSSCYDHLREVTRDDVITHLDTVHGSPRQHTVVALRSLFRWAKKNGTIFKNPTLRIRVGQREEGVIQPLEPEHTSGAVAAVTHPADRLILALAAVHAARPAAIRRLQLDDLDIGNRRLTIDGRTRPLDDLTLQVALEWLEFRRRRWRQELRRWPGAARPDRDTRTTPHGPSARRGTRPRSRPPPSRGGLRTQRENRDPLRGLCPRSPGTAFGNRPRNFTPNPRVLPLTSGHRTRGFPLKRLQFSRTRGGPGV